MPRPHVRFESDSIGDDMPAPSLPPLRGIGSFEASLQDTATMERRPDNSWSPVRPSRLRRQGPSPNYATPSASSPNADVTYTSNLDQLGQLDRSLSEANSHLRALLDMTAQSALASFSSTPAVRSRTAPTADQQRQGKRRRLDTNGQGQSSSASSPHKYGRYGQVEPGDLDMEIASCDGGMFSNEMSYAADNILRDDNTVYCTKGSRCNIILRHQDSAVFTLTELTIKAPASMNYSHPVREGMVFITMDNDDLLTRTARYQILYRPPCPPGNPRSLRVTTGSRQPEWSISIRHHVDGTITTRARTSIVENASNPRNSTPSPRDFPSPFLPTEFTNSMPDLTIITESSGHQDTSPYYMTMSSINSAAAAARRSAAVDRPPHIGSLPFEESTVGGLPWSDSEGNLSDDSDAEADQQHATGANALPLPFMSSSTRIGPPPQRPLPTPTSPSAAPTPTSSSMLLVPHARFFIRQYKSQCKIQFHPPISGRYVLLKMWSSRHEEGSNVDIQSVLAKGFVGPRYFPSTDMA